MLMILLNYYRPRRYLLHDLCKYLYGWMWKDDEWGFAIEDSRLSLSHQIYSIYRNIYFVEPKVKMTRERFERVRISVEITSILIHFLSK